MKCKYIIPNLTETHKEKLREFCASLGFDPALEQSRRYLEGEMNVSISRSTFNRIRRIFEIEEALFSRGSLRTAAAAVTTEESVDLTSAALILLKEKAFQLAISEDRADLQAAARILASIDRIENNHPQARAVAPITRKPSRQPASSAPA